MWRRLQFVKSSWKLPRLNSLRMQLIIHIGLNFLWVCLSCLLPLLLQNYLLHFLMFWPFLTRVLYVYLRLMWSDDLPLWGMLFVLIWILYAADYVQIWMIDQFFREGFVGEALPDRTHDNKHVLLTHKNLIINYNGDQVDLKLQLFFLCVCVCVCVLFCFYNWIASSFF